MEIHLCMRWPVLALFLGVTVSRVMATIHSLNADNAVQPPTCPEHDNGWHFFPNPDRCIRALEFSKGVTWAGARKKCRQMSYDNFIVDFVSMKDEASNRNACSVLNYSNQLGRYAIGLKATLARNSKDVVQYFQWYPSFDYARYFNFEEKDKPQNGSTCHYMKIKLPGKCVWMPFDCTDLIKYAICQTYYLNPCEINGGECPKGLVCKYTGPGSRECVCPHRNTFELGKSADDSRVCICKPGFKIAQDGSCTDNDECSEINKEPNKYTVCGQTCINTVGSYMCECTGQGFFLGERVPNEPQCVCEKGYKLNDNGTVCEDIDECTVMFKSCQKDEICMNRNGSYSCCGGNASNNKINKKDDIYCGNEKQAATAKSNADSDNVSTSHLGLAIGLGFLIVILY